jgi:hypothetical protein
MNHVVAGTPAIRVGLLLLALANACLRILA